MKSNKPGYSVNDLAHLLSTSRQWVWTAVQRGYINEPDCSISNVRFWSNEIVRSMIHASRVEPMNSRIADKMIREVEPMSQLIKTREAAEYLGLSTGYLANSRCGILDGPAWIKIGGIVRYDVRDLDKWIEDRKIVPSATQAPDVH